jgi:hypothetical protein
VFAFTESVEIAAPKPAVWKVMRDIRDWWPASNPEHDRLDVLDVDGEIALGTTLRIRERIAGIPGEAVGEITGFDPGRTVTWQAPAARYRLAGTHVTVAEGVTWTLQEIGATRTRVSARVWAIFPASWYGRLLEWGFKRAGGVDKDRKHARTELAYLKRRLEMAAAGGG